MADLEERADDVASGSRQTGAGVVVRPRRGDDLADCVRVLGDVHTADGYPADWPDRPAAWLTPDGLLAAWIAESQGRLAGHVGLARSAPGDLAPALWSHRTGGPPALSAVIGRLYVAPGARGQHIGARLLARAVLHARALGLHPVLDVLATDTAAVALYRHLGWTHLGSGDQQWASGRTVTVHCFAAPRG
ncbi:ribosomal protein S18 acetylase RimI-like enzyme [Streptomyces sp. 1114.5]|uniref:GNAT family N-acetyltransferase n=1 Tax=unclassified Streptomyces TaxID=2593676 RepID=UPI000BD22B3E|nr:MULTISPECIES: GNAT family N-acetyltransferase [unclassified Streptomyces]RKT16600.1 ribosomal protein S18 acetylase RimI-like enzyme [Streptomyces sp. 1114.5]SOB82762.1 Ribosomal protein S18 acetylase RimI [Streptomyces sp. 1331.2]